MTTEERLDRLERLVAALADRVLTLEVGPAPDVEAAIVLLRQLAALEPDEMRVPGQSNTVLMVPIGAVNRLANGALAALRAERAVAAPKPATADPEVFGIGDVVLYGDGCREPSEPVLVLAIQDGTYIIRRPGDVSDEYAARSELQRATLPDIADWLRGA